MGWIVRIQRGQKIMDSNGNFYPRGVYNPASPHYDLVASNDTHIPIKTPVNESEYIRP